MKNYLLVFVFSLFVHVIHAKPNPIKGNQYVLKGKMIQKIDLPPACGNMAWGTVVELEIATFTDSTYTGKNIGVIFTCPDLYGKDFFEVGKNYEIKVSDENQASFSWSIPNLTSLDKYKLKNKFWVIEAKKTE